MSFRTAFFLPFCAVLLAGCRPSSGSPDTLSTADSLALRDPLTIPAEERIDLPDAPRGKILADPEALTIRLIDTASITRGVDEDCPFYMEDCHFYNLLRLQIAWPEAAGSRSVSGLQAALLRRLGSSVTDKVDLSSIDDVLRTAIPADNQISPEGVRSDAKAYVYLDSLNLEYLSYTGRYATFRCFSYSTGGAHPSYAAWYLNYDLRLDVPLRLPMVLRTEAASEFVTKLLLPRIGAGIQDDVSKPLLTIEDVEEQLFVSRKELTESLPTTEFYRSAEGDLVLYYAPYEIACWAMGDFHVTFTPDELRPYLTDEGVHFLRGE